MLRILCVTVFFEFLADISKKVPALFEPALRKSHYLDIGTSRQD